MQWIWALSALLFVSGASAQETAEDVIPGLPFKEGDVLHYEEIDKLKDYLPPEFWKHREYFFFEGMEMQIGPSFRAYPAATEYRAVTEKYRGQARLGADGALLDYRAGQPFENVDCKGDPDAATKHIWNFVKRWEGDGSLSDWVYTYWDRGERLPLYYQGTAKFIFMSNRVEKQYEETGGLVFTKDKRKEIQGVEVEAPFDARGILVMTYRYLASDGPLATSKNDDTWVYVPDLRRVRRISSAQRTDAVAGTDFTRDDLRTFDGIPPQYSWECLGEATVLAPFNTVHFAYPYTEDYNFGPYGLSYANDRWEMRRAWILRFDPRNDDHPYSRKDMYLDQESYEPLYSFAYDRKGELWKIIWHNHRYSEDWRGGSEGASDPDTNPSPYSASNRADWYPGWEGVEKADDIRVISDIIVNVQTGTGNRIEFWNNHGAPLRTKSAIRRYVDIGRLNKGR
jgi:hypothetical protein